MKATVLSTHRLHPRAEAVIESMAALRFSSALDAGTLAAEGRQAEIVVVRAPLPPELFEAGTRLLAAIRHGSGVDMIPIEAATQAGVLVANAPGANATSVAEYVMLAALLLTRRLRAIDTSFRSAGWHEARTLGDRAGEVTGATLGIVGFGAVGRAVAEMAMGGFGMRVIASTRRPDTLPSGIEARGLDHLMAESDIVVLCCPLTAQTRGLIGAHRLALMGPAGLLINVSRGPVVDEEALVAALASGRIGGAALDVFASQPLSPGHPLLAFDTVLATPHLAGITEPSMERMGLCVAEEIERILSGELPANLVNPAAEAAYRRRFPAGRLEA